MLLLLTVPDKQTRGWDKLPSNALRKLLSRMDHQAYTALLEAMLTESGVVKGESGLQELRARWWLAEGNTPESLST